LRESIDPNAADALAVAVCHVNTSAFKFRQQRASKQS
jgi:Holliday junction resolvasome RuvABC endonuclease subunit